MHTVGTYCSFENLVTPPLPWHPLPAGQAERRAAATAAWRDLKPFAFGIFDVCSPAAAAVPPLVAVVAVVIPDAVAVVLLVAFLLLLVLLLKAAWLSLLQRRRLVIYAEGFNLVSNETKTIAIPGSKMHTRVRPHSLFLSVYVCFFRTVWVSFCCWLFPLLTLMKRQRVFSWLWLVAATEIGP